MANSRLFHTWVCLSLVLLLSCCSSSARRVVVLCAGDSITAAAYPRFLQRLIRKEGIRAKVLNFGRSGFNSGEYLRFLERKKAALKEEVPDFILLQLGTNDVRVDGDSTPAEKFYLNMKKIIIIFKGFQDRQGKMPKVFLATIPPLPEGISYPFSEESGRRAREEINPLVKRICAEENLRLVDNYLLFLSSQHLLEDFHPTTEGYRRLAENWYQSLKPFIK